MSQEYPHNQRAPLSRLSNQSLDEQDLDAADAFDAPLKLLVVDRRGSLFWSLLNANCWKRRA